MSKPNELPITFQGNKISLTMHPSYTGKGKNYPTYDLTIKLNSEQMDVLRAALGKSTIGRLLDGALIDIGAPIDM